MNPKNPSPRDELAEPLRSLIEDMASEPMPEDLIQSATRRVARPDQRDGRGFPIRHALRCAQGRATQTVSRKVPSQRSFSAVVVSLLALGICLMAFIVQEKPSEPKGRIVEDIQPAPPMEIEELPPPSLWAYRRASQSPGALEELLTQHAAVLLPRGENVSLHPFSRKEEL